MPLTGGKLQQLQLAAAASNPAAVPGHQQLPDSAANADAAVVKALQQNDDASPAQAVVNIMTDPDTDASDTESSTNQKGCSASQPGAAEAAAERTAAAGASEPGLKVSPLAPGVSMGSFSGQAWLQLLLLAAGYAGGARQLHPLQSNCITPPDVCTAPCISGHFSGYTAVDRLPCALHA